MKTIAAIATPLAVGGISVIRISGDEAIGIADRIFKPVSGKALSDLRGYTAAYGKIFYKDENIDDGIALVFRSPKSYTGEDVVEISCHGGLYISRKILRSVIESGAIPAANGEFTKRAFLNNKMSLTQAEAVCDLIYSQNAQSVRSAKSAMDGNLYKRIKYVCDSLISVAGHLSAWVDYPEEEIEEIENDSLLSSLRDYRQTMKELLEGYDRGKIIREGIETAIVGKPNVGKSTLMNLLSGYDKSIISDIPGTTRDIVEETIDLDGIVLRLSDTAGIRDSSDAVEKIGVERAKKRMKRASLILAVFDSSQRLSNQDIDLINQIDSHAIAVINKTDLKQIIDVDYLKNHFENIVFVSAVNKSGIDELRQRIMEIFRMKNLDASMPILANERQKHCAEGCLKALDESIFALKSGFTLDAVTGSVESAIENLLELTGESVTDAVVDNLFSQFCVGK